MAVRKSSSEKRDFIKIAAPRLRSRVRAREAKPRTGFQDEPLHQSAAQNRELSPSRAQATPRFADISMVVLRKLVSVGAVLTAPTTAGFFTPTPNSVVRLQEPRPVICTGTFSELCREYPKTMLYPRR